MLQKSFRLLSLILLFLVIGCAKRGSITGGAKDTLSPILVSSTPKNFNVNFKGNVIRLNFDEYVKLKDVNKQLVVSPPMNTAPDITPTNTSKFINIKLRDTLLPNTTYSLNFGQSIQDNNEGNSFSQFKYVFSTGAYIDSLAIAGTLKDSRELATDNFVNVMLYEINESFNDSTIYKEKPRYVTNTLDSLTTFKIENIKAGVYQLIALKDKNNNYKFDPKSDKIAFYGTPITIPTQESFQLKLFQEVPKFKALKPSQAGDGKIVMGFEGNPTQIKTVLKNGTDIIPTIVTRMPGKDSVNVWFKSVKVDSLQLNVAKDDFAKDYTVKLKNQKKDSLSINAEQSGVLRPRDKFRLKSTIPLVNINESLISLVNKDSTAIKYTTKYDEFEQQLEFTFDQQPEQKYIFRLLPGAFTDIFERKNDTLNFSVSTRPITEYGTLTLKLKNVKSFPVIVELTDEKGKILATEYSENSPTVVFEGLEPNKFLIRFVYDTNSNSIWDTGSYLDKRQPEEVIYFATDIDVRSNWDVTEVIDLGG